VYCATRDGHLTEVPYRVPDDDLDTAVQEHLVLTLLDGRRELTAAELLAIVDGLHREYLRPEYYSLEALRLSERCRRRSLPFGAGVDEAGAAAYRRAYAAAMARLRRDVEELLGASPHPRVLLLSERERNASRARGEVIHDAAVAQKPLSV
jgi:hypothetical protein